MQVVHYIDCPILTLRPAQPVSDISGCPANDMRDSISVAYNPGFVRISRVFGGSCVSRCRKENSKGKKQSQ